MKRCVLFVLSIFYFLGGVSQPGKNWSQPMHTIHAALFCNTLDEKIGPGCYRDFLVMKHELEKIADATHQHLKIDSFIDEQFTKANIDSVVSNIRYTHGDKYVFYFSSHGSRTVNDADRFPNIIMHNYPTNLNIRGLDNILKKRLGFNKPNAGNNVLLLTIVDVCNSIDKFSPDVDYYKGGNRSINSHFALDSIKSVIRGRIPFNPYVFTMEEVRKYDSLFSNASGHVLVTSSSPKQNSYFTDGIISKGSIFTNSLIHQIENAVSSTGRKSAAWDLIFKATKKEIAKKQAPLQTKVDDFFRPLYWEKPLFDTNKVNLLISRIPNTFDYSVVPDFFGMREWYFLNKQNIGIVVYKLYEKTTDGYPALPKLFVSTNAKDNFQVVFTTNKSFKIEAVCKIKDSGDLIINVMNKE